MAEVACGITEDFLLGGRVRLLQHARGHRAGTDAVLLAAAAPAGPGDLVMDVGAGSGAVGLMVAVRTGASVVFVERDAALADLCARNASLNGIEARVARADLFDAPSRHSAGLAFESVDLVVTNPPFLEEGDTRVSPDPGRAAAHVLPRGGLSEWLRACAGLLKPKGALVLIHRADRLRECLDPLARGFGDLRLRFVHPRADRPATRVLIAAVKGSRAPMKVAPPVFVHEDSGRFTPEAEALHRGERSLA